MKYLTFCQPFRPKTVVFLNLSLARFELATDEKAKKALGWKAIRRHRGNSAILRSTMSGKMSRR